MADTGHVDQGETVLYLSEPYPPCTTGLSKLKIIAVCELKPETHHRGRFLILKTSCEPTRKGSVMNVVKDQNADVAHLAVYNLPSSKSPDYILPKDTYFAVKEPYYTLTMDGTAVIRIDHPSDLIQLQSSSIMIPSDMRPASPMPSPDLVQLNLLGCEAYRRGDWNAAVDYFSACLCLLKEVGQDGPEGFRDTLHRNRAAARGHLGHYELSLQDALASVSPEDQDSTDGKQRTAKSFLRAGQAAYNLGNFPAAKHYFSRGLELFSKAEILVDWLRRTNMRCNEQDRGAYDFAAMSQSATEDHTLLDHASFLSNAKVAPAGHRGRGLFATRNLAAGDVVIVEKAFYVLYDRDVPKNVPTIIEAGAKRTFKGRMAERFCGITDKILHNPKQAIAFLNLHDGTGQKGVLKFVDGMATVDTFRVRNITHLNSFGCPDVKSVSSMESFVQGHETCGESGGSGGTGIWLHASHANHSCIPNASRSFIGDMMVVRATRNIDLGEEISLSYILPDNPYTERAKILSQYGFECDCALCTAEKSLPPEVMSDRAKFVEQFQTYILMIGGFGGPSAIGAGAVEPAEDLMKQLEETYPEAQYQHLPRLGCVQFGMFMCKHHGNPEEILKRALRALRDVGYFVEIKSDGGATITRFATVSHVGGVIFPVVAAAACWKTGRMRATVQLMELRKEIYANLFGSLDLLDKVEEKLSGQLDLDGIWE